MTDVVIPVKSLMEAKSRLQWVLSPSERANLVLAMLRGILSCLQTIDLGNIWLVSSDDEVLDEGNRLGARPLQEEFAAGYNQAVLTGLRAVAHRHSALVLPADLPFLKQSEVTKMIAPVGHAAPLIRIAPDEKKQGTNSLFLSAPDLIKPAFGHNIFCNHLFAANSAGIVARTMLLPSLAFDVDTPNDLIAFEAQNNSGSASNFHKSISFGFASEKESKGVII